MRVWKTLESICREAAPFWHTRHFQTLRVKHLAPRLLWLEQMLIWWVFFHRVVAWYNNEMCDHNKYTARMSFFPSTKGFWNTTFKRSDAEVFLVSVSVHTISASSERPAASSHYKSKSSHCRPVTRMSLGRQASDCVQEFHMIMMLKENKTHDTLTESVFVVWANLGPRPWVIKTKETKIKSLPKK